MNNVACETKAAPSRRSMHIQNYDNKKVTGLRKSLHHPHLQHDFPGRYSRECAHDKAHNSTCKCLSANNDSSENWKGVTVRFLR